MFLTIASSITWKLLQEAFQGKFYFKITRFFRDNKAESLLQFKEQIHFLHRNTLILLSKNKSDCKKC